jgi:peptide deformylase
MPIKSPRFKSSTTVGAPPVGESAAPAPEAQAETVPSAPPAAAPVIPAGPPRKIYNIVKYGDPILEKNTVAVTKFDAELADLAEDMFASMYAAQGVGLAAPQVGVSKRLTVIDLSAGKEPKDKLVLVNPEIIFRDGKLYEEEGCLSFPDIREKVQRAAKVRIRAQDEHGKWFERDGEELLSRCFQHEIDHLDGMLFIFRMSALKRDLVQRKIRKLIRAGEW